MFPSFVGIGAQRAGTSWLHERLVHHPELWLPPVKELHYFSRSPKYPTPNLLSFRNPFVRLFGCLEFQRTLCREIWRNRRDRAHLSWCLRYFFGYYDDRWYASLFEPAGNRSAGEICPAYSVLDRGDVEHMQRLMPDLKGIFLLRDPVNRAWSHYRHLVRLRRIEAKPSLARFKEWCESPTQALRSDYLRTIATWSSVFGKELLWVGFHDDIAARPAELLAEILSFLGVDRSAGTLRRITSTDRVNSGVEIALPADFERYLVDRYEDDLERLASRFGGWASRWRADHLGAARSH